MLFDIAGFVINYNLDSSAHSDELPYTERLLELRREVREIFNQKYSKYFTLTCMGVFVPVVVVVVEFIQSNNS